MSVDISGTNCDHAMPKHGSVLLYVHRNRDEKERFFIALDKVHDNVVKKSN